MGLARPNLQVFSPAGHYRGGRCAVITPIFRLNSREQWRPQPVETVERFGTIEGQPVQLPIYPRQGGGMNFPPDMRDPSNTRVAGYHRVVEMANLWWHQYWLWYLYNPWEILGVGQHEGDWEFVQIACVDESGDHPVLMTASQHRTGEKREFWRCELDAGRPVVYVALGSHANFFTPGDRGEDVAKRTRQSARRHRMARIRELGDMAWDLGQSDWRRPVTGLSGYAAGALGATPHLPR